MATAPTPAEVYDADDLALYVPMRRLTADLRKAAETMGDAEVRYVTPHRPPP